MNIRPARSLVTFGAAAVLLFARSSDANAPSDHYQVNYYYEDANTVTDLKSGLTWKLALGSSLTWAQAKTYCQESGLHWRLPTEKELLSLVDLSKSSGPTIDTTYFGTGTLGLFWSATPLAGDSSYAWGVNFGPASMDSVNVTATASVRCVTSSPPVV